MPASAGPLRTCVGCRGRSPAGELLRVVAQGDLVAPDPARRLPGRGAHLHVSAECLDSAVRRRAFSRALRTPAADLEALRSAIEELLTQRGAGVGAPSPGKG